MNKFWVMVLVVIVSAVAGAVMFYFSDRYAYWCLQKKYNVAVEAGGTPDEQAFEPEKTRLIQSGYLIVFEGKYRCDSGARLKEVQRKLRAIDTNDVILKSTFGIVEDDNEVVMVRYWCDAVMAEKIKQILIESGLIPHSPSQQ